MKTYLSVYPHCYLWSNKKNIFIFNPKTKEYIYIKDCKVISSNSTLLLFDDVDKSSVIINKAIEKKLIYEYKTTSNLTPLNRQYNIRFISSIEKLRNALGYNNGHYVLNYITSINLYVDNTYLNLHNIDCYKQIKYPKYNSIKAYSKLDINRYTFPNLKEIIITGDLDIEFVESLLSIYSSCAFLIKTIADKHSNKLTYLLDKYENISLDLIINSNSEYTQLQKDFNMYKSRVNISILIDSINKLKDYSECDFSISYIPLLYNIKEQHSLIQEMLLLFDDIINNDFSLEDIYQKELIDMDNFGCVTILSSGDIVSTNELIGNIKTDNLIKIMTEWINKDENIWFKTRKHLKSCSECFFYALCPPITIYERQGYIEKACNKLLISKD